MIVLMMFLLYLISSMMMRKVMAVFFLSPKLQMVSLEKGLWMKPPTAMPSNRWQWSLSSKLKKKTAKRSLLLKVCLTKEFEKMFARSCFILKNFKGIVSTRWIFFTLYFFISFCIFTGIIQNPLLLLYSCKYQVYKFCLPRLQVFSCIEEKCTHSWFIFFIQWEMVSEVNRPRGL